MDPGSNAADVKTASSLPAAEAAVDGTDNLSSNSHGHSKKPPKTHYPLSFWLAFLGLCCTGLVSALDGSIVATALPSIIDALQGGDDYVWVVNVYFLTRYIIQILFLNLPNGVAVPRFNLSMVSSLTFGDADTS